MNRLRIEHTNRIPDVEWMPFPGGELEGSRPRVLCPDCRVRLNQAAAGAPGATAPTLCFQCYRLDLERMRRLHDAAHLNTASEERFQTTLPFQPVNRPRLTRLKRDREAARAEARQGSGRFVEKRRRAQIEARNQLGRLLLELKHRRGSSAESGMRPPTGTARASRQLAADLHLPESWLPFVAAGRH
jgi:hypothetical protein